MSDGRGVSPQLVHRSQNTSTFPTGQPSLTALQHGQLAAVHIDAVVPAANGDALVGRGKLHLGDLDGGVTAERYLGDAVVFAVRGEGVGEVVHGEAAGGGAHGDE